MHGHQLGAIREGCLKQKAGTSSQCKKSSLIQYFDLDFRKQAWDAGQHLVISSSAAGLTNFFQMPCLVAAEHALANFETFGVTQAVADSFHHLGRYERRGLSIPVR